MMLVPVLINAFRLTGSTGDPPWLGDDLGGMFDPDDPRMTRRDFLIRAAIATAAVTVGGAINALAMMLAR